MSENENVLSTVAAWETVAEGYAETTSRLFRGYMEKALDVAKLSEESRILDVACGPGALSLLAAMRVQSVHAIDFSESMIKIFRKSAESEGLKNITIHCGNGQELPFSNEMFDIAFSMFGLMFFPNRVKGYAEIYRTLKPGGQILISSWAPVSDSPAMQVMFGAIRAMKPEMPESRTDNESLENPEFFEKELLKAGFRGVEIHPVTQDFPILSVDGFWSDIVKGSAPVALMKSSMPSDVWKEKERAALEYLNRELKPCPTSLSAKAWLGYGRK